MTFREGLLYLCIGTFISGIIAWLASLENYPNLGWIMMVIGGVGAVVALLPEIIGPRQQPRHGGLQVRMNPPPAQGGGQQPNGNAPGANNAQAVAVAQPQAAARPGWFSRALDWTADFIANHWRAILGTVFAFATVICGMVAFREDEKVGWMISTGTFFLLTVFFYTWAADQLGNAGRQMLRRNVAGIVLGLVSLWALAIVGRYAEEQGYVWWFHPAFLMTAFLTYGFFRIAAGVPGWQEWWRTLAVVAVVGVVSFGYHIYKYDSFDFAINIPEQWILPAIQISGWVIAVLFFLVWAVGSGAGYGIYRRVAR